jgi:hypothetical protein
MKGRRRHTLVQIHTGQPNMIFGACHFQGIALRTSRHNDESDVWSIVYCSPQGSRWSVTGRTWALYTRSDVVCSCIAEILVIQFPPPRSPTARCVHSARTERQSARPFSPRYPRGDGGSRHAAVACLSGAVWQDAVWTGGAGERRVAP